MSVAILPKSHSVIIGYILATIDNRQMFLYETIERAKKASLLNIQSYNARYHARAKRERIVISEYQMTDFKAISDAQKAMAIDCFLYNSDNAKGFDKSDIVQKLRLYRETLEFNESDYDAAAWFIDSLPLKEPKSHEQFIKEYALVHCVLAKW